MRILPNNQKIGLALSGGGARGILHIGVLQALHESRAEISSLSGTSMGAIVAGFYAAGMEPREMLKLLSGKSFLNMFRLKASLAGLLEMKYLREIMDLYLPDRFEDLKIPLTVCATNLNSNLCELLNSGSLKTAITASASIPVLFAPVQMKGSSYVDGGVVNNLPAIALKGSCDHILGVEVNHGKFTKNLKTMKNIALEVFHIVINNNSYEGMKICNSLIRPELSIDFDLLNFTKANDLFEIGYQEGKKWYTDFMAPGDSEKSH